jgi:hypothetical protein
LHAEQGLGDTLQFVRYASWVADRGGHVILACQRPLVELMKCAQGVKEVVPQQPEMPLFDVHVPLMSLPLLASKTEDAIPHVTPYITPDSHRLKKWQQYLADIDGFKIGIAWQGNPNYKGDRLRSIALAHFEPLAKLPGVRLISLQKNHGVEQLDEIDDRFEVLRLPEDVDADGAFLDTAAIMQSLDLVVTSDTSLPHLAGAVGAPVFLALPLAADWRWMHGRRDSPWYPTMRLFRQPRRHDWSSVFEEIAQEVAKLLEIDAREIPAGTSDAEGDAKFQSAPSLTPHVGTGHDPRVGVLSFIHTGNFGDRLGYHLLNATLPVNTVVSHGWFSVKDGYKPVGLDPANLDLLILGMGNSLFRECLTPELLELVGGVRSAIGIFGIQYAERIVPSRLHQLLDTLDWWFARYESDISRYGAGRDEVIHLGDWLIDACPVSTGAEEESTLVIDEKVLLNLPLDRTIQQIQRHKRVFSTRVHPLLASLPSADEVAYREQYDFGPTIPSGKFEAMLSDVFGRSYPPEDFFTVDRSAVLRYKARVRENIDDLRLRLATILS